KKEIIIEKTLKKLNGKRLDFVYATPPCQGMSKNGRGKLLNNIRKGIKPKLDFRNQLIIPVIEIVRVLKPNVLFLENVPEMENTIIESPDGNFINIIDYIKSSLSPNYCGRTEVVEFADYGVPQRRQRLITIFSRLDYFQKYLEEFGTLLPPRTHSANGKDNTEKWITVRDVISNFPKLDAIDKKLAKSNIPFHSVPILDKDKYFWVSNTPPEKGAFDNQCIKCGFSNNTNHGAIRDEHNINRSKKDTPIKCQNCGELLPRPWVYEDGEYRLMKGFTSAYKRMKWDLPASALTRNLSYACSDHKLHPEQNRVLSLFEAFYLHTISEFEYHWERSDKKNISDKTIREIIGESIPPRGLKVIFVHLVELLLEKNNYFKKNKSNLPEKQYSIFA
ncbi:MAG: DNA cytosine methyltransferase, partial [Melioribacteraceae bacterium]